MNFDAKYLIAWIFVATPAIASPASDALVDRTISESQYNSCLRQQAQRLIPLIRNETAETIVRASEHYCALEWFDLDLKIHLEALYSNLDADRISQSWQDGAHNRLLVFVLESRNPAVSPKYEPDVPKM